VASTYDVIEAKARDQRQSCALNTKQAAVILGMEASALEKTRSPKRLGSDGVASIPFERVGKRKVIYRLAEVLMVLAERPGGIPKDLRMLAVLMGEDFCRRAGVPYPKPSAISTTAATSITVGTTPADTSPALKVAGLLGIGIQVNGDGAKEPRKRGPRSRKAEEAEARRLERLGATVHRHRCEFVSMQDWLAGAEPDDAWLFVVPEAGRPIDFTTSVINGGPGDDPLEWLTLSDYLDRIARAAEEDRAKRERAELEADEK
jgi:hypothetical protein